MSESDPFSRGDNKEKVGPLVVKPGRLIYDLVLSTESQSLQSGAIIAKGSNKTAPTLYAEWGNLRTETDIFAAEGQNDLRVMSVKIYDTEGRGFLGDLHITAGFEQSTIDDSTIGLFGPEAMDYEGLLINNQVFAYESSEKAKH